jgi:hypothetical protein
MPASFESERGCSLKKGTTTGVRSNHIHYRLALESCRLTGVLAGNKFHFNH